MDADDGTDPGGIEPDPERRPLTDFTKPVGPGWPDAALDETGAPEAETEGERVNGHAPPGQPGNEWWRHPAPEAEEPPPDESSAAAVPDPSSSPDGGPAPAGDGGGPAPQWWRGQDVKDEIRDAWGTHGPEAASAAYEIGAGIGDALSARLDPHPIAQRHGLDIRWMRLKYNIPAVLIALLVTWGGKTATDRMTTSVTEDGIFAPLGAVLLVGLLIGVLMVLPIGSFLGEAVAHLFAWAFTGLFRAVAWCWRAPYIGYLLRLVVAVACWAFAFAVLRQVWRGIVYLLTGV